MNICLILSIQNSLQTVNGIKFETHLKMYTNLLLTGVSSGQIVPRFLSRMPLSLSHSLIQCLVFEVMKILHDQQLGPPKFEYFLCFNSVILYPIGKPILCLLAVKVSSSIYLELFVKPAQRNGVCYLN